MIKKILPALSESNHRVAVQLASLPEEIRGYDLVKKQHVDAAAKKRDQLFGEFFI